MGLFRDIIDGLNSLANLKQADAEQVKAKTQNQKVKNTKKENRELKKALSRSNRIGIISILIAIAGIAVAVYFVYYPVHH